jgi:hypothetical protein
MLLMQPAQPVMNIMHNLYVANHLLILSQFCFYLENRRKLEITLLSMPCIPTIIVMTLAW